MAPWVLGAIVASTPISTASAQGLAPEDPLGGERRGRLQQVVERAGSVRVTVRDGTGVVPGAQVRLVAVHPRTLRAELGPGLHTRTDARGQATWSDVPPGEWFVLAQDGPVLGQAHMPALVTPGKEVDVAVVLDEGQTGGVLPTVLAAESGEPLDASVEALTAWSEWSVRPLEGLEPGRHRLRVTCPGRATTFVAVDVEAGPPRPVLIRLRQGGRISGRVAGFGEVSRISLQVSPTGPCLDQLLRDGAIDPLRFRFDPCVPAGREAWVRVEAPGVFPYHQRVCAPAEGVVVQAPARPAAVVEVRSAEGGPRECLEVELLDDQGRRLAVGLTDDEGRLRLLEAPPAGARLRCCGHEEPLDPSGLTALIVHAGDEWGDEWSDAVVTPARRP